MSMNLDHEDHDTPEPVADTVMRGRNVTWNDVKAFLDEARRRDCQTVGALGNLLEEMIFDKTNG